MAMKSCRGSVVMVVLLLALIEWFGTMQVRSDSLHGVLKSRNKRSISQLGRMIECTTGRDALDYNGYGCHCGFGGFGIPIDDIDSCCQAHDDCYDEAVYEHGCGYFEVYYIRYKNDCNECAPASAYGVDDKKRHCKMTLCECDTALANCFNSSDYNEAFKRYPKWNCW
ncbi:acidic phospholipase A2-like [Glandiceps talaboti]